MEDGGTGKGRARHRDSGIQGAALMTGSGLRPEKGVVPTPWAWRRDGTLRRLTMLTKSRTRATSKLPKVLTSSRGDR